MSSARQRLVDDVIRDEGSGPTRNGRLFPYLDCCGKPWRECTCAIKGNLTIGYGCNLDSDGISPREAADLLDHRLDAAVIDLAGSFPWYVKLDEVRQRALTNMRYNLGHDGFAKFRQLIRALSEQDYPHAAASAQHSTWYGQVGRRGPRIVHALLTGEDL